MEAQESLNHTIDFGCRGAYSPESIHPENPVLDSKCTCGAVSQCWEQTEIIPKSSLVTCLSENHINNSCNSACDDSLQHENNFMLRNAGYPECYCPLDYEKDSLRCSSDYENIYVDLNIKENFIDEYNLLMGNPTEHVPMASQFVTVESENTGQVVPEADYLSTDDEFIQVVPHWDCYNCSDTENMACGCAFDLTRPTDSPTFLKEKRRNSINRSPQLSGTLDEDESVVPDIESFAFPQQPSSTFFEESDCIGFSPDYHFGLESDHNVLETEDLDRPVNSCATQDFTVPNWAIEE